jgi:Na+-translocating ferredoxin:NAD+ oxidoreductase RnfC subunit
MERLQIKKYDQHPRFDSREIPVDRVSIPLKQHLGAPARAVVKPGDRVKRGDLLGEIPDQALGARIHASLAGRVVSVDGQVVIQRGKG